MTKVEQLLVGTPYADTTITHHQEIVGRSIISTDVIAGQKLLFKDAKANAAKAIMAERLAKALNQCLEFHPEVFGSDTHGDTIRAFLAEYRELMEEIGA